METVATPVEAESAPTDAAPQAAKRSRGGRRLLAAALLVALLMAVAGGAFAFANASLSSRYSPGRALLDYFAAQKRGDAAGMMANATFLRPAGSSDDLFQRAAVAAMLQIPQNSDVSDVRILSSTSVDSSASNVRVSMTWAGASRVAVYSVRKDLRETHYLLYNTWRVEVPYATIAISLPNQAGLVTVDGIFVPTSSSSPNSIPAIEGFHTVAMIATSFYEREAKSVDGVDANPTLTFVGSVRSDAKAAIAAMVSAWFVACDAAKYWCPNHTYTAPNDGYRWYLTLPGYGKVYYTAYAYTIDPDLTSSMKIVVSDHLGQAKASGTCAATLTVDGSQTYAFTGRGLLMSPSRAVAGETPQVRGIAPRPEPDLALTSWISFRAGRR